LRNRRPASGAGSAGWIDRVRRALGAAESDLETAIELAPVWEDLTPAGRRALVLAAGDRLANAVRALARSEEGRLRAWASAFIGDLPGRIEPAIVAALAVDDDAEVRRALGRSLTRAAAQGGAGRASASLEAMLAEVARVAADVREPALLDAVLVRLAGLAAAAASAGLTAAVGEAGGPTAMALRGAVRRTEALDGAGLVRLARHGALAPAALDALESRLARGGFESAASAAHLLRTPSRRVWLMRGRRPGLTPTPAALASALESAASAPGAALWCDAVGAWSGRGPRVESLIDRIVAGPRAPARWRAALSWARTPARSTPTARHALDDLVFDPDARVARSAFLARAEERTGLARRASRSPHATVRALAQRTMDRTDPWALMRPGAGRGLDAVAARRALARDRPAVVARLREAIGGQHHEDSARIGAVRLALRMGLAREVELELLSAAGGDSARLAATAVSALGRVGTPTARQALRACLSHPDARARANALEALARLGEGLDEARARLERGSARERGNAALALASLGGDPARRDAVVVVEGLLSDPDAGRRLTGVWAAGRLGCAVSRIAAIAKADAEPRVRDRARRTARRLLAQMSAAVAPPRVG